MAVKTHFQDWRKREQGGMKRTLCHRYVKAGRVTTEKSKVECQECRKNLKIGHGH